MLVQFSVKNYRSLKEKATLSLLAGADKEHAGDLIIADGKKQLVPAAAIYKVAGVFFIRTREQA
jgi:AAA15 family ATPase/GTPase